MAVSRTQDEGRTARGDPRRRAPRVRRARAARRLDRGHRPAGRHLAALRVPPLRHEEGALPRRGRALLPRDARDVPATRPKGSAARRRSRRSARPTWPRLAADPLRLRAQMQAYAACDDPEIREVVRDGYGDLVAYVERVVRASPRGDHRVLRDRDAAERVRLDGADRRRSRAVGAAPPRRLQARPD